MFNPTNELMLVSRTSAFMENWKYPGPDKLSNSFRGLRKALNDFLYENELITSLPHAVL